MITKEQYLQALTRVAQYEQEQLNIPIVSGSYTKEDAMKWYNGMIKEEWIKIEKKHGYYGHDIGTTEADIEDMYKAEFNYR
jgi:hypothetical protein